MLWHWTSMTAMTPVAFNRNHCWPCRDVIGKSTSCVDWNALQLHQTLADLGIRTGVNLTTLSITEEVVQGLEPTLSVVVGGMLTEVTSVADGIVDWAVG